MQNVRQKRKEPSDDSEDHSQQGNHKRRKICPRLILESLSEYRIHPKEIKASNTVARKQGATADVELAQLHSSDTLLTTDALSAEPEYIAVKKMRFDDDTDEERVLLPFANELSLLSELSHQNVVKLRGFAEDTTMSIAWMILRWEANGNVREFLHSTDLVIPERTSLIYDVICGIQYLHKREPPISHGDLKSLNILVDSQNHALITDFGSARVVDVVQPTDGYTTVRDFVNRSFRQRHESPKIDFTGSGMSLTLTGPVWTLRWAAPELLEGGTPHLASDIWAFGWICWEIMTNQIPFSDVPEGDNHTVVLRVMAGDLPETQDNTHLAQIEALRLMMRKCWTPAADQRPLAQDCLEALRAMDRVVPSSNGMDGPTCIRSTALLRRYGRRRARCGKPEEGVTYVQRALHISKATSDLNGTADALCLLGDIYQDQAEYGKAEAFYIQTTNVRSRIGDPQYSGDTFQSLGDLYRVWSKAQEAEASYIKALDMYTQANSGPRVMAVFHSLGQLYFGNERDEGGLQGSSELDLGTVCNRLGDLPYLPDSLRLLANMYVVQGRSEKAALAYTALKDSYARGENRLGVADVSRLLGDLHRVQGKGDEAEASYSQAKDIYTALKSPGYLRSEMGLLGVGLKLLGDLHRTKGEYSKAESSFIKSRDVCVASINRSAASSAVRALGKLYIAQRDYAKAELWYREAQDIFHRGENDENVAIVGGWLGDIYMMQKQYDKAEASYVHARNLYGALHDKFAVARTLCTLADVARQKGDRGKEQSLWTEAMKVSTDRARCRPIFAYAALRLGYIHTTHSNYKKARKLYAKAKSSYIDVGDTLGVANALCGIGDVGRLQHDYVDAESCYTEARELYSRLGNTDAVAGVSEWLRTVQNALYGDKTVEGGFQGVSNPGRQGSPRSHASDASSTLGKESDSMERHTKSSTPGNLSSLADSPFENIPIPDTHPL